MILLVNLCEYFKKSVYLCHTADQFAKHRFSLFLSPVMSAMERKADIFEECRKKMIPTFQVNAHQKQRTNTGHSNNSVMKALP